MLKSLIYFVYVFFSKDFWQPEYYRLQPYLNIPIYHALLYSLRSKNLEFGY